MCVPNGNWSSKYSLKNSLLLTGFVGPNAEVEINNVSSKDFMDGDFEGI